MTWAPKKNVVVPMDFSEDSEKALEAALDMVSCPGDLHLVHVLAPLSPMEPGVVWGNVTTESRRTHVRDEIRKWLSMNSGYEGVNIVVRIGSASREITQYAEEIGSELIVIASHGHSRTHDIFVGSTATRVVHLAKCPVLVIKHAIKH